MEEPKIIQYLENIQDKQILIDENNELINYLRWLYEYETNRTPIHKAFENTYKLLFFDASAMLNYHMNPWVIQMKNILCLVI